MRVYIWSVLIIMLCITKAFSQTALPNPNLVANCPYHMIFVLDESSSIAGTGGAGNISAQVRSGARALVQALSGTGTSIAVVEFNTTARNANIGGTGYRVVDAAYLTAFDTYILTSGASQANANNYDPDQGGIGYTNWEAAFQSVEAINNTGPVAELVIFFTDGEPTASAGNTPILTPTAQNITIARNAAILAANDVKTQGSHIFVVALPNGLTPAQLEANVQVISGLDRYPDLQPSFPQGDYTLSTSQTLIDDLRRIAELVCKVELQMEKTAVQSACSGDTVVFTLTVTNVGLDNDVNVVVTDTIPNGYTYVSDNGGAATTLNGNILTWNVDTLVGAGGTISLEVTVIMNSSGNFTNRAHVIGQQEDTALFNNTAEFTVDLALNCDDGDPCTLDFCRDGVCAHDTICCFTNEECADQNLCTIDTCAAGECLNVPIDCSDNNVCNGIETCDPQLSCQAGDSLICDDGDPCTTDVCDPISGCSSSPIICNDQNICTVDTCIDGRCVFANIVCNDNNACTTDGCQPEQGCAFAPVTCNDQNACTADTCVAPTTGCTFTPIICDDDNECTIDNCAPTAGGCFTTPVICDDQNFCTTDGCNPQTGCTTAQIVCNDDNECTLDTCNPQTGCVFTPTIICDDNDECTTDGCSPETGCTFTEIVCDDQNACTTDGCNPQTGCTATRIECDDNNACTTDDCDIETGCTTAAISCDDGDICNGVETCDSIAGCLPGTPLICDDGNVCNGLETCDSISGCLLGTPLICDDDNLCNGLESCDPELGCLLGTPLACDDENVCNGLETCDPQLGCVPGTPLTCDDGNLCNGLETCDPIIGCVPGSPLNCDDGNVCNGLETCDPQLGCLRGTPLTCDDGNVCNGIETCNPTSGCQPGNPLTCDDNNVCNGLETCDAILGCQPGNPLTCDDNNICNGLETCNPISGCQSGTPLTCSDNNVCNGLETCDPILGCQPGNPLTCDDNNVCNGLETCDPIAGCQQGTPLTCDDNNVCNGLETCNPLQGCQPGTPVNCDDGNVCNGLEFCDPLLGCQPGTTLNCDDADVCMIDSCSSQGGCFYTAVICDDGELCTRDNCVAPTTGCVFTPVFCNDNDLCTIDTCITGLCDFIPVNCDDGDVCTDDFCTAGNCFNEPIPNCCIDVDDCTAGDACVERECIDNRCFYTAVCCDDDDDCTWDYCDGSGCVHAPKFCEDSDPCTDNICVGAVCTFPPAACDDGDLCTADACISGTCVHTPLVCNDGDPCTTDFCRDGCQTLPVECSDGDPCTTDSCIQGNCFAFPVICNDDDPCTIDACVSGVCIFTPVFCFDNNLCTTEECVNGVCIIRAVDCSDGDLCTQDICTEGVCSNPGIVCNDSNACTIDRCLLSVCIYEPNPVSATISKTDVSCACGNPDPSQLCKLDFAGLPHGTIVTDQYAVYGIMVSAVANAPGKNFPVIFNTFSTGTSDPDLELDLGNFLIVPFNVTDISPADGLVDFPNDNHFGGKLIFTFDPPRDIQSFVFIDQEADDGVAMAYDMGGNLIATVPILNTGTGSIQTVMMNVSGASMLVIQYSESGAVGEIIFDEDCTQCCDGSATVTPFRGVPPHSVYWSTGDETESIGDLCAGTYCVTVTDANGCQTVECVEIESDSCDNDLCETLPIDCDDDDPCTTDRCENGICFHDHIQFDVIVAKTDISCDCIETTPDQICTLDYAGLPHGTILTNQYAAQGINVSVIATHPGKNFPVIFNTNAVGTPDPDLQVDIGNIVIIPFNVTDTNPADGLVDVPNDNTTGGKIIFTFDSPREIESFVFVDEESNNASAKAYDLNDILLATVPIPPLGDASVQTVVMNVSGVSKLEIQYSESGGVGEIIFGDCSEPCCDASAAAFPSGGTPPYSYEWSTGDETESTIALCIDVYCVTVTDASGCEAVRCVNIVNDPDCRFSGGSKMSNEGALEGEISDEVSLAAYPNPFTDKLNIEFRLAQASHVRLEIFNVAGQRLATLFDGYVEATEKRVHEYAREESSAGVIIYRLVTENGTWHGKAMTH